MSIVSGYASGRSRSATDLANEGDHVMLTERKDVDVTDDDHLFVILCKDCVIDDVFTPYPMISTVCKSMERPNSPLNLSS